MKNLIRITALALVIVLGVFAVRCTGAKPEQTTTDSTNVVVDSTSAGTVDTVAAH
jgi:hypothetical protein